MLVSILGYGLAWSPKQGTGDITLKLQTGQVLKVPVKSADEFTAIATILNEAPVYIDLASGIISTGFEEVGGT